MWELNEPVPVKLIIGILAADEKCLDTAKTALTDEFGEADLFSEAWDFTQTNYYVDEVGEHPLRQFVSIKKLIDPGELAGIKHTTNRIEQKLADELGDELPRPVNLDPGIIEPSKLILATTKNFSHRIYIGEKMYAEITLIFHKGKWQTFDWTYPDYRQQKYFDYFDKVRRRLTEQLREIRRGQ